MPAFAPTETYDVYVDDDGIWVTEVWQDEASHKASLQLPEVIDAISRGKPLIAEFDQYHETVPVGGHGL